MFGAVRPWRFVAVAALVVAAAGASLIASRDQSLAATSARSTRATFHDAMRQLWEDHIVWTRMFIVSSVGELPDLSEATSRFLANQEDIGEAVAPFYGEAAGEQLTELLRDHILGAAALLEAAKAGDDAAVSAASAAWYANGDDIAAFLNAANPRAWPLDEMEAMMRDHLDLTLAEAVARLEGRFADDVAAYDRIHAQILHMADMLSDGIIAQFPAAFAP